MWVLGWVDENMRYVSTTKKFATMLLSFMCFAYDKSMVFFSVISTLNELLADVYHGLRIFVLFSITHQLSISF